MGKLLQGILGGISGKVGNVVGSSWKGIPIIKAKPLSVANPRSAGQVAQRSKLSNIVAFSAFILSTIIKPLWDRFAQQQSGYNAFISANIDLFADKYASPANQLVISSGKMAPTAINPVSPMPGASAVVLNWVDDSGSGLKLATDEAYAICVNETQEVIGVSSAAAVRSAATLSIDMPANFAEADIVNVYLAFRRADGTVVSDSSWAPVVV